MPIPAIMAHNRAQFRGVTMDVMAIPPFTKWVVSW